MCARLSLSSLVWFSDLKWSRRAVIHPLGSYMCTDNRLMLSSGKEVLGIVTLHTRESGRKRVK